MCLSSTKTQFFVFLDIPTGSKVSFAKYTFLAGYKGAPRFQFPTPSIQAETLARWARYLWDIGCFQVNRSGWRHFTAWMMKLRDGWQRSWRAFYGELHRIPVERLGTGLPIQDGPEEWASLYAEIRQHLFPWMRLDAREWVTNHFETYLNTTTLHIYEPALRHGDFGTCNILYDRATQAIGGVIDFGFAGIGDPALDIAAISRYGETFMGRFSDTYPEIELMLERARFYTGTYALQEALHGFKKGDQDAFESGMALYI